MSNLPATTTKQNPPAQRPSALQFMASRLNVDAAKLTATLKATVFKGASDEEMLALVVVSNEYDLNPLLKEIYAFPAKGGGICPIVSVDGWNKMLIRQPTYNGKRFEFKVDEQGQLVSCTCFIHVKGRDNPDEITEYLHECYRKTDNWDKMPYRMLRNRTLCQAARMSFGFSGITNPDEAEDYIDVTATPGAPASLPSEPPPKLVALPESARVTPQSQVEALALTAGFTGNDVVRFLMESGMYPEADTLIVPPENRVDFSAIPKDVAKRILLAEKGFLKGLADLKAQA